jgi:hypothetical protein
VPPAVPVEFATAEFAPVKSRSDEHMSRRLFDGFYSILFTISFAALSPIASFASDPAVERPIVPVTDFPHTDSFSSIYSPPSQCCPVNWGAINCGHCVTSGQLTSDPVTFGTHDSMPSARIASLSANLRRQDALQGFCEHPAMKMNPRRGVAEGISISIPTAIMSVTSVRVQQIIEPFAMVGPRLTPSRKTLTEFLDWCNKIADAATPSNLSSTESDPVVVSVDSLKSIKQIVSIDRILASLTDDEPLDARTNYVELVPLTEVEPTIATAKNHSLVGSSPIIATIDFAPTEPSIAIAKIDPLVGSSPIIVTVDFAPTAMTTSDVFAKELRLWSVFPTVTRPFCVRQRTASLDFSVVPTTARVADDMDHIAAIGNVESMLADARSAMPQAVNVIDQLSRAKSAAQEIGKWVVEQDAAEKQLAWQRIATVLPRTSIAESLSDESLRSLGGKIAKLAIAGKTITAEAASAVAKKLPSDSGQVVVQLAKAATESDRQ